MAQLNEALGHLALGGAHAEAGLLAIHGVEDHSAVSLDADGGPSGAGGVQSGVHLPVGDQLGHAAQGLDRLAPALIAAGHGKGDGIPRLKGPQAGQGLLALLGVQGEHGFALGNGDTSGGLQHLLHHILGLPADGRLNGVGAGAVIHRGQNHIYPRLGVLGGSGEVVGQQGQAAHSGTVRQLSYLIDAAAQLYGLPSEGHGDRQPVAGDESGAVGVEADGPGVVVVACGPHNPVGHHQSGGRAGGEHIPVAVQAGHHPFALALQGLGHAGQGHPVGNLGAVGHRGHYAGVGGILHIVLGAQVGIGIAPEHVLSQAGPLGEGRPPGLYVPAHGLGRRGRGDSQGQRQTQGRPPPDPLFHTCPPNIVCETGHTKIMLTQKPPLVNKRGPGFVNPILTFFLLWLRGTPSGTAGGGPMLRLLRSPPACPASAGAASFPGWPPPEWTATPQ